MILAGCQSSGIHRVDSDRVFHPVVADPSEISVFLNNPSSNYTPVAFVDSFVHVRLTDEIKADQLRDLQVKARDVGADAVIQLEQLEEKREGMVADPTIPFHAWKQGDYELYFLRGLAVRLDQSKEPEWEEEIASESKDAEMRISRTYNAESVSLDSIQLRTIPEEQQIERPLPGN